MTTTPRHAAPPQAAINTRYHIQRRDGLYGPIPFLFVSQRMCNEILVERGQILDATPANRLKQQQALLERYDPRISVNAFSSLLALFNPLAVPAAAEAQRGDQQSAERGRASEACGLRNTSGASTAAPSACARATASSTRPWAGDLSHTGSACAGSPVSM